MAASSMVSTCFQRSEFMTLSLQFAVEPSPGCSPVPLDGNG